MTPCVILDISSIIALARAINLMESIMALPVSFVSESYNDNTKKPNGEPESASFRYAVADLTPGNVAAQEALIITLSSAIEAVVIGVLAKRNIDYLDQTISVARAGSTSAQRENKWLCRYHDASNNAKFRISIPTADLTLLPDGSEFLDLTADPGLALKTAWEAVVKSPSDPTHATVLDSMQFVGRTA